MSKVKKKDSVLRTIRLPEDLRNAVAARAANEKRSVQQHIVYLLEQDVKKAKRLESLATA